MNSIPRTPRGRYEVTKRIGNMFFEELDSSTITRDEIIREIINYEKTAFEIGIILDEIILAHKRRIGELS